MLRFVLALAITAVPCQLYAQSQAARAKAEPARITFQLKLGTEQSKVRHPATIGLRGSTAPLSWDQTYPLTDKNHDGIYEATIAFASGTPVALEYKFVHDTVSWESSGNRTHALQPGKTTLPVQTWNDGPPSAQVQVYQEIAAQDKMMFDAYNARNVEVLLAAFDPSLEFFHDLGGVSNYEQNAEALKKILATPNPSHRELVPGSLEVYPIKDYGAIEVGVHRFCRVENGKEGCGDFKFLMVWRKKDGVWKITRVVSYGH